MLTSAAAYLRGAEELCSNPDSNGRPPDEKKPLLEGGGGGGPGAPAGGSAAAGSASAPRRETSTGRETDAGNRPSDTRGIDSDARSTGRTSGSEFKSDSKRSDQQHQQTAARLEQIAFDQKLAGSDAEIESDVDAGVFLSDWSESEAFPPGPFQASRSGLASSVSKAPMSYALVQPVNRLSPDDKRHFLTQKLAPQRFSTSIPFDSSIFHH